jgi:hypothetical protein
LNLITIEFVKSVVTLITILIRLLCKNVFVAGK